MDGIINVLKPPGLTSRQVVSIIKGITKEKKVGHAGTLDPGASGVLPVMIGKATKLFEYIGENKKEYIGEFTFGVATTTQDSYGEVVNISNANIDEDKLKNALAYFVGECEQTPSIYSAVHINGKRAYDYAYAGQEVELPKRTVTIFEAELLTQTGKNSFLVRVLCSTGCYIRSLCEDVASKLDTVGYLSLLIRTKTGSFCIDDSFTIDELQDFAPHHVVPLESILAKLPYLQTSKELDKSLYNGNKIPITDFGTEIDDSVYRILDSSGVLWALGQRDGDIVRMKNMLRDNQ